MWFVIGVLVGAGLVGLYLLLKRIDFTVRWYEWLVGAIGIIVFSFGLDNVFALAQSESSTGAPGVFFLLFALPGILILLIAAGIPSTRFIFGKYYKRRDEDVQET